MYIHYYVLDGVPTILAMSPPPHPPFNHSDSTSGIYTRMKRVTSVLFWDQTHLVLSHNPSVDRMD